MELRTFGVETIVIECAFTDSKGRDVSTRFILNEKETCRIATEYAEHGSNLSIIDWMVGEIGDPITVEGMRNFLNDLEIESQMDISVLD